MSNVSLGGFESVPVEVILHELAFLKPNQNWAQASQNSKIGVNLDLGDGWAWTVDSLSDGHMNAF